MDILYSEGGGALNWDNVLLEIKADFEKFINEGAWSFLRDDASMSGEESEEQVSDFSGSAESSESDFSADDEDSSSVSPDEPSDSSEAGRSWDELNRRALEQDKKAARKFGDSGNKAPSKRR